MSKMRKEYDPNKVKRRKRKPIVYIICEGKETETLYFKHFRSRNCLVDIIPISSKHKAAEHLVKHAKALISQADYYPKDGDQLWCVFDCDDNKDSELQAAISYAEKHGYKIAYSNPAFEKKDLCLVAVPSYGGRIPSVVTDMFRKVKADGTKAILVAVFGNRMIDDTLLELQDVLEASGFVCIAGMEAVAEHSLMHQFGTGRPDQQDEKELLEFAAKIMQNSEAQRTPAFPGNRPYREYGGVPLKPVANGKCTSCGLCAKECPAGAIPLDNPKMTDKDKCISCMHCVAVCPKKARNYSKLVSFIAGLKMKKVCSGRKENKLYL